MPDISGAPGTVSAGTITPDRAVSLSGWFSRGKFVDVTGISGAASVGSVIYSSSQGYDWFLVDYADRLYPWASYCGIPGGVPNRTTIYTSLGVAGQAPTYAQSVTPAQANAAIAACPSGQVVYLNPGTYSLNSGLTSIQSKAGITLRGAGPGQTIITSSMYGLITADTYVFNEASGIAVSSGYTKGSMSIVLASAPTSMFQANNLMIISEAKSIDKFATHIGVYNMDGDSNAAPSLSADRFIHFTTRITSVVGNTVNFATPLPLSFTAGLSPRAYPLPGMMFPSLIGIEDMTFDGCQDPIRYWVSDRCWFKDLEFKNNNEADIGHLILYNSVQPEIRRCYIHDVVPWPETTQGCGFGIYYGTSNGLFIDNITNRTSAAYCVAGAAGNAFLYNYSRDCTRGATAVVMPMFYYHGRHVHMNLVEGNIGPQYCPDGYHGSSSHDTLLRNHFNGLCTGRTNDRWLLNLNRGTYYESVIGNVLGDPSWSPAFYDSVPPGPGHFEWGIYRLGYPSSGGGSAYVPEVNWSLYEAFGTYPDGAVASTLLRHGNYDYFNNAVVWDGGITSHSIPDSLFFSSKPSWFGSRMWPSVDPLTPTVNASPAKHRWDTYGVSGILADLFADEE